tara:strand:+ start:184 stop:828 length:645 start_codon:yes stop_codon:yes gene_type:complete
MKNFNKLTIIDNFLENDLYSLVLKKFNDIEYEVITQNKEEKYSYYSDYKDKNFPSQDEVYMAQFCTNVNLGNDDIVDDVLSKIKIEVKKFITDDDLDFRTQFNSYRNNGEDYLRCHFDDYIGDVGYVFYMLNNEWKYDWGGLLHYVENGEIKTVLPTPNRLIVTNNLETLPHWVTPVNKWSKENRNTLVGFAVSDKEKLKSWNSEYIWSENVKG